MIKVDDTPVKIVVADLNSLYSEIEQETNRIQFFLKVARYGEYIQRNKSTIEILSNLYREAKEDTKPYLSEWRRFIKVWKEYASDLIKLAEKVGIKDNLSDPFSTELATITLRLKESDTSVWETDLSLFYLPYQTLVWKFKEIGKPDLLIPKHIDPKDGMVAIYPNYVKALDEWEIFKNSRESKVWWGHFQICRLAAGVLGLEEQKQYFKTDNVIDDFYRFEFREIERGNINSTPIVLHKHKYDAWIKRLHNYLVPRLQNFNDTIPITIGNNKEEELSKRELKAKISNILKTGKFGKKEKALIRFLAKDFKPKSIKTVEEEIDSKAGKQLKARVKGKLKNTGFSLEIIRADRWGAQAQYQLKYHTQNNIGEK